MTIYMEDINTIASNAVTDINHSLKEKDIQLSENELDLLWDEIQNMVEKLAKYPEYRNYN